MNQVLERSGSTLDEAEAASLNQAVFLINSLGGDPLPLGADRNTLKVTLENQASKHIQHWLLQLGEQRLLSR